MKTAPWTLALLLLAGCTSSADPLDGPSPAVAPDGAEDRGVLRTLEGTWELQTQGAASLGPYYARAGVPYGLPGLPPDPMDHNCVQFVLRGVHLASLEATATWNESSMERQQTLYHYLKDDPGPFRGGNHTTGTSPLTHEWRFDREGTTWLAIGMHPQDGPVDYGTLDRYTLAVRLAYWTYDGAEAVVDETKYCVYQNSFLEPGCVGCRQVGAERP